MTGYRYTLTRELGGTGRPMLFVMLNPSTADDITDDPTIRRCIAFARRESAARLEVVNLYPVRATDPAELVGLRSGALGLENNAMPLYGRLLGMPTVVCAWGAHPAAVQRGGVAEFARLWRAAGQPRLWCLGTTKHGAPRHPLYVRGDTPLEHYTVSV